MGVPRGGQEGALDPPWLAKIVCFLTFCLEYEPYKKAKAGKGSRNSEAKHTFKLGYNDHGYNKITAITNEFNPTFWSQMTCLLHKSSRL